MGHGSLWIRRPRWLFHTPSVHATWADFRQTTFFTRVSSSASSIPGTQGVRSVEYLPGIGLLSCARYRFRFAQSVELIFSGGWNLARAWVTTRFRFAAKRCQLSEDGSRMLIQ